MTRARILTSDLAAVLLACLAAYAAISNAAICLQLEGGWLHSSCTHTTNRVEPQPV